MTRQRARRQRRAERSGRLIQIKAILRPHGIHHVMDDGIASNIVSFGPREYAMGRARVLKKQAEWCIDMATKALTPHMFEKYVELAGAYQQQAVEIERRARSAGE